jgi:hypothetical protein
MSETSQRRAAPRMHTYWLGERAFAPSGCRLVDLGCIPSCYDVVYLAFALVRPRNVISMEFLCTPPVTLDSIRRDVRVLQSRGVSVILAVGGWGGNDWGSVTSEQSLCRSICKAVDELGLDGVSIDYMGDRDLHKFRVGPQSYRGGVNLKSFSKLLRRRLGKKRMVLAAHEMSEFVRCTLEICDWVMCIDYKTAPSLFDQLASLRTLRLGSGDLTPVPLIMGITVQDPLMTISQVEELVQHAIDAGQPQTVFWVANEDHNEFTGLPPNSYAEFVNSRLP